MPTSRRNFIATIAGAALLPQTLLALNESPLTAHVDADTEADRDLQKILTELPHARPHMQRMKDACDKYASIYPLPLVLPAKVQAIESGYNPDAISVSYAVGGAQFMPYTARELGANLPPENEFEAQKDVLKLRRRYGRRIGNAVEAFRDGDDIRAKNLRAEAETVKTRLDKLHEATMADFKKRMFAMSPEERRAYDQRFDPATSDDMLVHYLAKLARSVKRGLGIDNKADILLLAGVAYNAGPGRVKRKPGIPVIAQNVEYANKIMLFQTLDL